MNTKKGLHLNVSTHTLVYGYTIIFSVGGNIIYFMFRYCPMTDKMRSKTSTRPCTVLTMEMKIAIAVSACVALLLFVCAICCWKRSRK